MNPVLGYFVFIDLGNGCLGSKYGNLGLVELLSEAATRISAQGAGDVWVGDFVSLWLDALNPPTHTRARLFIRPKTTSQYLLEWRAERAPNGVLYFGEGMISGGQLLGCYWNQPIQDLYPQRADIRQMPMTLNRP
jgi:hypothetical protein